MVMHFFFKGIYNGYPTLVIAILFIGGCTAIIGDVAGHLGCFINLKDGVNAIAFVALGTSVPGTEHFPAVSISL
jgi:solute carrier family 8 (sodium/calcium exchanger)